MADDQPTQPRVPRPVPPPEAQADEVFAPADDEEETVVAREAETPDAGPVSFDTVPGGGNNRLSGGRAAARAYVRPKTPLPVHAGPLDTVSIDLETAVRVEGRAYPTSPSLQRRRVSETELGSLPPVAYPQSRSWLPLGGVFVVVLGLVLGGLYWAVRAPGTVGAAAAQSPTVQPTAVTKPSVSPPVAAPVGTAPATVAEPVVAASEPHPTSPEPTAKSVAAPAVAKPAAPVAQPAAAKTSTSPSGPSATTTSARTARPSTTAPDSDPWLQ